MSKQKTKTARNTIPAISVGSDPEFMLLEKATGEIVSAIPVVGRDKYKPIVVGEGIGYYFDNVMLESTMKPAKTRDEFVQNIGDMFRAVSKNLGSEYEIVAKASHEFDIKHLQTSESQAVGCSPEFNADKIEMIMPPDFSGNLRSCGGHVSVGRVDFETADENDTLMSFQSKIDLIKTMDYFLGVTFTLLDADKTSTRRRAIYGTPSSHRPTPFGAEYRVLGNFWTRSPKTVALIFDLVEHSVNTLVSGEYKSIFEKIDKQMVNSCITENNRELASEIVELMNLPEHITSQIKEIQNSQEQSLYEAWGIGVGLKELVG